MAKVGYNYDHHQAEPFWQKQWEDAQLFWNSLDNLEVIGQKETGALQSKHNPDKRARQTKNKMALLFAFAYPSGMGLHVGHVESKTALDILARYNRMNGKDVFFPVGWDAFGLPAENYAIKTGVPPVETTKNAINTFRRQVRRLGISYDWANELATCHPGYYKWTQWLFLQLYKAGLAYKGKGKVNWCPSCQTVLANEQVVNGLCERCDSQVVQKDLEQWYFKITQYKDELLSGLDLVDWPEPTKLQQKNWIGKSEGVKVDFTLAGDDNSAKLTCFTTRIDTIFGVTFVVISPEKFLELKLAEKIDVQHKSQVETYLDQAFKKTEEERKIGEKDKTGVETGLFLLNPVNGQKIPLYVADYVLAGVGTGVVMGVPAHDDRDWAFAKKHGLNVLRVIKPAQGEVDETQCFSEDGVMINSGKYDGLTSAEAREQLVADFTQQMSKTTTYKLRDWLISRQRYWGAPIPVVYDPEGNAHPVKDEHLPWLLPTDVDFKPTGESPLKSSQEFIERTERLYGKGWRPEFDTMDTFVDSSWYFLRYLDSRNETEFASKENLDQWMPFDLYLIGPEHIVLHLLYSRFFTKFLRDQGYLKLPSGEPFAKMRHQGMILGPDGKKMSKSKGNVINPDEIIEKYGADTLRIYEMFMGPLEADKPWDDRAVAGVKRFLDKIGKLVEQWSQAQTTSADQAEDADLVKKLHQTIKKVGGDIPNLKFNTAIASMMELVNFWQKSVEEKPEKRLSKDNLLAFVKILAPFAPFMTEELWHRLQTEQASFIHQSQWPVYDQDLAKDSELVIAVQVNGKVRGNLSIEVGLKDDQAAVLSAAKALPELQKWINNQAGQPLQIVKEIYIPGKIVSLVVR